MCGARWEREAGREAVLVEADVRAGVGNVPGVAEVAALCLLVWPEMRGLSLSLPVSLTAAVTSALAGRVPLPMRLESALEQVVPLPC